MDNPILTKQKIYKALEALPPDALAEVARVVNHLQQRTTKPPVRLGGLWKDVPLDISNRDIRNLRRHLSRRVLKRRI